MRPARWNLPLSFVLVLAWSQGQAAQARDRKPPKITHSPVTQAPEGAALEIRAKITDPSGVFEPTLFYRSAGSREYLRATLVQASGEFVATIPAAAVVGEIEYFLEAFDEQGNGPARVGSPNKPLVVKVAVAAIAPVTGTTTTGTTKPPPDGTTTTTTATGTGTITPPPDGGTTTTTTATTGSTSNPSTGTTDPATTTTSGASSDEEGGSGLLIAAIAGGAGALLLGSIGAGVLVWALFLNTPEPPGSVTVVVTAPAPVRSLQGAP